MRALTVSLALVSLAVQAQTAPLNDTGATQCISGSTLVACTILTTGDAAPEPRQDARFGRDAAAGQSQLTKVGGGAAGFDFTPLDSAGIAIAIVGGIPASTPACVHDNVTNLTWEVKTPANMNDPYTWDNAATYVTAVNGAGLCGAHAPWRLPTRGEVLSIEHFGATSPPFIDANYFPNTRIANYWTGDVPVNTAQAWNVNFADGTSGFVAKSENASVRLVRSGQ